MLLIAFVYFRVSIYPQLDLISGFSAKSVASAHFIDGRDLQTIQQGDNDIPKVDWATNEIHDDGKYVTSTVHGLKERKAIYRPGLGVTLINDDFDVTKPYLVPHRQIPTVAKSGLFPKGDDGDVTTSLENVDYAKLNAAVANAFDKKGEKKKRSRSVLVVYKDQIIAEKYADGFNRKSKILGWSMTKSITATYFGILQKQGKIDIMKPAPVAEWANDRRKDITINDLLHMNSGLEWEEDYGKISDVTKMLFTAEDMTKSQIDKPLVGKPNATWNYSSGTTNLLSGILRQQFKTHQEYLDFWYSSLLDKIGMNSALVETDMAGNFVGSSYGWATVRDWAKFGLLYLHKGNWNGKQLLSEQWVKQALTPTPAKTDYGYMNWFLNTDKKLLPDAPASAFMHIGNGNNLIYVDPEHELVAVVRWIADNKAMNSTIQKIQDDQPHWN